LLATNASALAEMDAKLLVAIRTANEWAERCGQKGLDAIPEPELHTNDEWTVIG
jgi:hypothetical protein